MRKNCKQAFENWMVGSDSHPARSIWTDGETLWSYGTAIATRDDNLEVIFNATRYSPTTTCHQNAIFRALRDAGMEIHVVTDIHRGSGPYSLHMGEKITVGA